jgi:hypothetical protein
VAAQLFRDRLKLVAERLGAGDFGLHQESQLGDRIGGRARRRARLPAAELDFVEPGPTEIGADPPRFFFELVGVAAQSPGERRRSAERQPDDAMLARGRSALGLERRLDPLQRGAPIFGAGNIDADAAEFCDAGQPLLDRNSAAVVDRDQRGRPGPRLVDVAPLRISGHHDCRPALIHRSLMDVAERPIGEARPVQVGRQARRIAVVRRRAAEAGVQHADIDRAGRRLAKLRQQALGRVLLGEAHAVDRDVERAGFERHCFGAAGEHFHRFRQGQFARDARFGVMVAADDESRDFGLMQPSQLIGEKTRRLHRGLLAVVEVAGDQQGVDPLGEAKIDDGHERPAGRAADQVGERRLAQGQRAQG